MVKLYCAYHHAMETDKGHGHEDQHIPDLNIKLR